MTANQLPIKAKQLKVVEKIAKKYRLTIEEVIAVACLSFFDGYVDSLEADGAFLDDWRRFLKGGAIPQL